MSLRVNREHAEAKASGSIDEKAERMTGHVTALEIEGEDQDWRIEWDGPDGSCLRLLTRRGPEAEWSLTETVVVH